MPPSPPQGSPAAAKINGCSTTISLASRPASLRRSPPSLLCRRLLRLRLMDMDSFPDSPASSTNPAKPREKKKRPSA